MRRILRGGAETYIGRSAVSVYSAQCQHAPKNRIPREAEVQDVREPPFRQQEHRYELVRPLAAISRAPQSSCASLELTIARKFDANDVATSVRLAEEESELLDLAGVIVPM